MTTLVAIPWGGDAPDLLRHAVASALAQPDAVVLVAGDGVAVPPVSRSSRFARATVRGRHGPPFVQQAMLLASPHEHIAPLGADDWIDPDHLALMAETGPNAAPGVVWWHDGPDAPGRPRPAGYAGGERRRYEVGRFVASDVRAVGGWAPHEPFGQDTLMLWALSRMVGVPVSGRPTYHRVRRPGTLTTDPATGIGSGPRADVRRRNREASRLLLAAGCPREWPGRRAPAAVIERCRAARAALVPASVSADLAEAAAIIALVLA